MPRRAKIAAASFCLRGTLAALMLTALAIAAMIATQPAVIH
jgi:hypothetical protein